MSQQNKKKHIQYAAVIYSAIERLFEEDNEFGFDAEELNEDDNLTDFIHALSSIVPASVYAQLTGDSKNHLEFNHIVNQLVFQYSTKETDTEK